MTLTYCKGWFRHQKRVVTVLDESAARKAHEQRRPYTVVLGDVTTPECFIDINNDYVGVGFLDDLLREYLSYTFDESQPGRLFLSMATQRDFDGESDKVTSGTTYHFKENGAVTIETEDFVEPFLSEGHLQADVSGNWDDYPKFGQYSAVARVDRPGTRRLS
jgi:hypothetical protein